MGMLLLLAAAITTPQPVDYGRAENWLCRPGREQLCTDDAAVTIVGPDGRAKPDKPPGNQRPAADCFYVYPTVSLDPTPNSDLDPGREERGMVAAQLAPFRGVCRPFAPLYRQVTLTALRVMMHGGEGCGRSRASLCRRARGMASLSGRRQWRAPRRPDRS